MGNTIQINEAVPVLELGLMIEPEHLQRLVSAIESGADRACLVIEQGPEEDDEDLSFLG